MRGLNAGSGQRPFKQSDGWINLDCNAEWKPDIVGDWNDLSSIESDSLDIIVSHHSIEHVGLGEADSFISGSFRVLRPGGSLLVFVPDMKALAQRWMLGQIDDYIYNVNVYGAYMGHEADRHKWSYSFESLSQMMLRLAPWETVQRFDWRDIPGATLAKDWWVLAVEAKKPMEAVK